MLFLIILVTEEGYFYLEKLSTFSKQGVSLWDFLTHSVFHIRNTNITILIIAWCILLDELLKKIDPDLHCDLSTSVWNLG